MFSKSEFIDEIIAMRPTIHSKTKAASYTGFRLEDDTLHFVRINTGKSWHLAVSELTTSITYRANEGDCLRALYSLDQDK